MSRAIFLTAFLAFLCPDAFWLHAGNYAQDFAGFSPGTTDLQDGSEIASNNGVTQVRGSGNPYLRLTSNGVGGTSASYRLPALDPGESVASFAGSFQLQIGGAGVLADGVALSFGDLPAGLGGGENGYAMSNGLVIAWDTYPNSAEVPSIEIFAGGSSVFNQPFDFGRVANRWVEVDFVWDGSGLDLSYDGDLLVSDLPVPGFLPDIGNRFAFTARTGGARQSTYLDDLVIETVLRGKIETGGAVITEFVADNGDSYEDDELDEPDWLEVYNGHGETVNLEGYALTTDPTLASRWLFPAVSLAPYQYLVVCASEKNRAEVGRELHTDFTLKKAGGYLALLAPDGTTVLNEYHYDGQAEDVSFGELGNERNRGYLETATPGARNEGLQSSGPPGEGVKFDRPGGVFAEGFELSILPPDSPSAVVRYTLNGTIPTVGSTAYTGPIPINTTTTVRARVFETDRLPGELKSRTFLKLTEELHQFSSNLPVVVIDSGGVSLDAAHDPAGPRPFRPVYTVLFDRAPGDGQARLSDLPHFAGRGGMHVRGQSSSGFPKKQYAWETWNNEDEDKDVSFLGMPAESDWILNAPYSDKTLMRNTLVYEASREVNGNLGGVRTRYVEVFFNQSGGSLSMNDYRGVYVLMEKIKRGDDRIDVEKLNDRVRDPDLITGGYIFKRDKPPYSRPWNTARERVPLDTHYPEEPSDLQFEYLTGYVDAMERALHGRDFRDPDSGYAAFLEVPSFIDAHLFTETFKNIDGYRISTYFTKPRGEKISALPIWDYNLALGNANYLNADDPTGWYYADASSRDYYWYDRLFQDPAFELAYWDRFWELRRGIFSDAGLLAAIDRQRTRIDSGINGESALTRNFEEWDVLGEYVWPNPAGWAQRASYDAEVQWMKEWLLDRLAWIESQSQGIGGRARPPAFNQYGGEVASGFELTMAEPNGWDGEIYFTLDGEDPRVSVNSGTTLIGPDSPCEALVPSVENGGSELSVAEWTHPAPPPNAAQWLLGRQGVGYERSSSDRYDPFINLDVQAELAGHNRSCYLRIPFTITSPEEVDALTGLILKIRYDDSFVAYLNGVEIVREANAPTTVDWQSGAEGEHDDDEAVNFADFPVTLGSASVQLGDNMLAIHGLNRSLLSSDALWSAYLVGTTGEVGDPSARARKYEAPLVLAESSQVKARVYDGSRWSPLTQGFFQVDTIPASAGNLVVSEMNYRPALPTEEEMAAGFDSRGDFEFLELMNIHPTRTIDLSGVTVSDGVAFSEFTASSSVLAPGARLVLAKNEEAFRFRLGDPTIQVAGEYTGSLRNEGERLTLRDAEGFVIKDFSFSPVFPWPPSAGDGRGYSLVLSAPRSNPEHADPLNWQASAAVGGSPAGHEGTLFSGNPATDHDRDGVSALLEYALGTRDDEAASGDLFQYDFAGEGVDRSFLLTFPVSLRTEGIEVVLEWSDNLITWSAKGDGESDEGVELVARNNDGRGLEHRTYRSRARLPPADGSRFFRLRVITNR